MNKTTNFNDIKVTIKESVDITNQDALVEVDNLVCTTDED